MCTPEIKLSFPHALDQIRKGKSSVSNLQFDAEQRAYEGQSTPHDKTIVRWVEHAGSHLDAASSTVMRLMDMYESMETALLAQIEQNDILHRRLEEAEAKARRMHALLWNEVRG